MVASGVRFPVHALMQSGILTTPRGGTELLTPIEIAAMLLNDSGEENTDTGQIEKYADLVVKAIEQDRAQRDIYGLIAEALQDRADGTGDPTEANTAEAIRELDSDDLWDGTFNPFPDNLQRTYGENDEEGAGHVDDETRL